jgi:hypothetical protein
VIFMALLLDDLGIDRGAPAAALVNQQLMQFHESLAVNSRRSYGDSCARHRVEHPRSHGDNSTSRPLDLQESAGRPLLHTANADRATKIWTPSGSELPCLARHGQNERLMVLNRKNALFAGSDRGDERAVVMLTSIRTARLTMNGRGHTLAN